MTSSGACQLTVLHASEFIKGGVSTYLNALVREQLADPHFRDVRVIVSRQHREFLPDVPDKNLVLFDYPKRSFSGLRNLRECLTNTVGTFQPDVVQLTSTFPGVVGRIHPCWTSLPKSRPRPAIVYCAQGWSFLMDTSPLKRFVYRLVERTLSQRCDRILCISDNELRAALAAGMDAEKCVRIYNALPINPPEPEPVPLPSAVAAARARGNKVYLFVGRYDRQKALDLLTSVFDGNVASGDILLTAGGNAINSDPVRFGSRMFDLGWMNAGQISYLLSQTDALLVPSRWEGFGLVATEAMRAGKAVICSDRGGLPEVVSDGHSGIVLKSLTSESIAETLGALTPEQLQTMGQAGHQRFREIFTIETLNRSTREAYQQSLISLRS